MNRFYSIRHLRPERAKVIIRLASGGCLLIALLFGLFAFSLTPLEATQINDVLLTLRWSSTESYGTAAVAWGDYDNDGDLDLAVGNSGFVFGPPQSNQLYRNDNGTLTLVWSSDEEDRTYSIAWADYDSDGDLDLAVGNEWGLAVEPNRLYRNDNGVLTSSAVWSSAEEDQTYSIAWADYDNDGDPDLAVGNLYEPNRLYRNDDGSLILLWSSDEADPTSSIAWADYDNDGDLDLAAGNGSESNRLYRNDGGLLTSSAIWSSAETDLTNSIAWGDYDGDGDLDLAVGNDVQPNRLYRNDNGVLTAKTVWSSDESDKSTTVVWGDYDSDGDVDLMAGNIGSNRLYRNDGGQLTTAAAWSSSETDGSGDLAWGDYDGDGTLDLVVGNDAADGLTIRQLTQPNRLYRNEGALLTSSAVWLPHDGTGSSVAWGDYDGDGDLDLAYGNRTNSDQQNKLYRNDNGVLTPKGTNRTPLSGPNP